MNKALARKIVFRVLNVMLAYALTVLGGAAMAIIILPLTQVNASPAYNLGFMLREGFTYGIVSGGLLGLLTAIPVGLCGRLTSYVACAALGTLAFGVPVALISGGQAGLALITSLAGYIAGTFLHFMLLARVAMAPASESSGKIS